MGVVGVLAFVGGYPLSIVMRSLDNPRVDALIQSYRTMHGNKTVDKDDFVRGLLSAMRAGQTVGILMDTNMTPPQGVFRRLLWNSSLHGEWVGEESQCGPTQP